MNTDKNVYILGAGFSKELGLPLQDEFLLFAKEVYFSDTKRYSHFQVVFEYQDRIAKMRKFLSYPLMNLEHLFNLIEMDIFYSNREEIVRIREAFVQLICDVLKATQPPPFFVERNNILSASPKYSPYLDFLTLFLPKIVDGAVQSTSDSIISFNYDLVLEATASIINYKNSMQRQSQSMAPPREDIHFDVVCGTRSLKYAEIRQVMLDQDHASYWRQGNVYAEGQRAITLLKLHGSINCTKPEETSPFIVPPTWNKSDMQVFELWERAYKELTQAKRIVILGYSFPETDTYVKSLIALALNENPLLQHIYFINPDTGTTKASSLSLVDAHFLKYCDYKEWTFSQFASSEEGQDFQNRNLGRPNQRLLGTR